MNTPWRLYAWIAIIGLAAAIILGLTACGGCSDHGGTKWTNGKLYECNDGTWA